MQETLYNIDLAIFTFINQTIANPVFDLFFPLITNRNVLVPIYLILLILLVVKGGKKAWLTVATLLLAVFLADKISSNIIKEYFQRARPCHVLSNIHLLVDCGAGKSFPSSHAVNNFVLATILSYYYRNYAKYFITVANLVAFSRVVVGVHYPADILGGAIIGTMVGFIFIFIENKILNYSFFNEGK